MTREAGTAAQENVTPFGSHRPDRGDAGLLKGRCKGEDQRQVEYLTSQVKESLQILFAGTHYAEEETGFFLQQSNLEIPMPLRSVWTLWSFLGSCRVGSSILLQNIQLSCTTLCGTLPSFILYLYFCVSDVQNSKYMFSDLFWCVSSQKGIFFYKETAKWLCRNILKVSTCGRYSWYPPFSILVSVV